MRGFFRLNLALWLVKNRKVKAVGIDTPSPGILKPT